MGQVLESGARRWYSFRPLALESEEPSLSWLGREGTGGGRSPPPPVPSSPCAPASEFRGRSGLKPSGQGLPPPPRLPATSSAPSGVSAPSLAEERRGWKAPEIQGCGLLLLSPHLSAPGLL